MDHPRRPRDCNSTTSSCRVWANRRGRAGCPSSPTRTTFFTFRCGTTTRANPSPSPLDHLAHRERGRRETEEFDRWLYVAITRAKESLTLTWTQPKADSWAGRSQFCAAPAGVHARGAYAFEVVDQPAVPTRYLSAQATPGDVRPPWGRITPAAEERRSVTDLVGDAVPVGTPNSTVDDPAQLVERWRAQTAGTRIHRALEALKFGRSADAPDFAEGLEYVLSLRTPPMRELIAVGQTEWGFQVQTPRRIIEGQIDLWAKHQGVLYVVDYKSGSRRFTPNRRFKSARASTPGRCADSATSSPRSWW